MFTMSSQFPSTSYRALLNLIGLYTCTGAYLADWDQTRIYNSRWPLHAKLHNGQTISMGLALGATTLYYLWYPLTAEAAKHNPATVTSLYWVT